MPIINLTLQGKQAIGDGTKIVCMNGDYVVRLNLEDCEDLLKLPVKKLILKVGTDYQESPVEEVVEDGQTVLQAELPVFDYQKSVELGVCGKESEDTKPTFTSEPATFSCSKSILCGALVLKKDPTLESLHITKNGRYLAMDKGIDGFYEVDVSVAAAASEQRTIALSMPYGNQIITPSMDGYQMSQVTVTKPLTLISENIKRGVNIGGVVGTFDKTLIETEVYQDGEYTPPEGVDGFSKFTVKVGSNNYARVMRLGDSFSYDYNTSATITIDVPGVVKYENDGSVIIITAITVGACSVVIKDFNENGEVVNTVHYAIIVDAALDHVLPVEAKTTSDMQLYLTNGIVGAVVKYTGETDLMYIKNALYIVEEYENTEDGGTE